MIPTTGETKENESASIPVVVVLWDKQHFIILNRHANYVAMQSDTIDTAKTCHLPTNAKRTAIQPSVERGKAAKDPVLRAISIKIRS